MSTLARFISYCSKRIGRNSKYCTKLPVWMWVSTLCCFCEWCFVNSSEILWSSFRPNIELKASEHAYACRFCSSGIQLQLHFSKTLCCAFKCLAKLQSRTHIIFFKTQKHFGLWKRLHQRQPAPLSNAHGSRDLSNSPKTVFSFRPSLDILTIHRVYSWNDSTKERKRLQTTVYICFRCHEMSGEEPLLAHSPAISALHPLDSRPMVPCVSGQLTACTLTVDSHSRVAENRPWEKRKERAWDDSIQANRPHRSLICVLKHSL
jgi:hypothetical protein